MEERVIRVSLTPHPWDNAEEPYFWFVAEWHEQSSSWVNSGLCGWAKTPTDAFNQAYQSHIKDISE